MHTVTSFTSRKARYTGLKTLFFSLISIPLLAAGMFAASPAWAVHDAANFNNIEMDGNTVNDGAPVEGVDDWDDVFNGTATALRQVYIDDSSTTDTTSFAGSNKDIQYISEWACETGNPQAKANIQSAYGATYSDAGDIIIYAGADRLTNNGTAYIGVWLFQQPVDCVSAGAGTTPFSGTHLDGDYLLVAEYTNGGAVSNINVYRWWDPDGVPGGAGPGGVDECLGGIAGDCSDAGDTTFSGVACSASPSNDPVCGSTNVGTIDSAWRTGIESNEFFEVGANLSDLLGEEESGCFAQAIVESRSSATLNATLKDFVSLDLSTCGTLEVVKETVGGNGTFGFGISPTAGGPDTFDLVVPGNESQMFGTVEPDTYTVSETSLPPGPADPFGWNLTGMECVNGTTGTVTPLPSHTGGSIDITVGLGDDVVCTFTNTFTPPPGTVTIEKVCDGVDAGGQTFDFALGGFGASSTLDCADGSVTLACGASISCEQLPAGDYTVDETVPTGWVLSAVDCVGGDASTCGPAETPDATITLGPAGEATATFTNTEQAEIVICKNTLPPGVGGDFSFTGGLGAFLLAHGECTDDDEAGPFVVAPGVPYDVTEGLEVDYTLSTISCSGINWTALDNTVTITPAAGEAVLCTFENTENPGYIQVCKTTVTTSGANPAFGMNLMGPDGDLPVSSALINGECDFGLGDVGQVDLTAGAGYSVSEDAAPGWITEVACVGSAGAEDPNNIDVSPNEEVVCTFQNTQQGSITIEKLTMGDVGSFDFTGDLGAFSIDTTGANPNDTSPDFSGLAPDTYGVAETVPPMWTLTDISCSSATGGSTITIGAAGGFDPGDTDVSIELAAGDDVGCTFTNGAFGSIAVAKETLPDGSSVTFDFTGDITATLSDGQTSAPVFVEAGSYSATETVPDGWVLTSIVCDDNNSTGEAGTGIASFIVGWGEDVICTYTNTIENGNITVLKFTDPPGSPTQFDFTANYSAGFMLADGEQNDSGPLLPTSEATTYSVAEGIEPGWDLVDVTCNGDEGLESPDAIDLGPGETVSCVFSNVQRGMIEVEKQTLPDGSLQTFDFDGDLVGTIGDGGVIFAEVPAGQYITTETVPVGWDLVDISCSDDNSSGLDETAIFDVSPGETVRCVFTNQQRGIINVVKNATADGTFGFSISGPEFADGFVITTSGGTGEESFFDLLPGGYDIEETDSGALVFTGATCDNGDSPANLDLGPGEEVTCTFINTLPIEVPVNSPWALLLLTLMLLATGWYFRPAHMRRF